MVAFEMLFNCEADCEQYVRIAQCLINFCSPITKTQPFRLMVSDGTAVPRKSTKALKDRGMIHASNVIPEISQLRLVTKPIQHDGIFI